MKEPLERAGILKPSSSESVDWNGSDGLSHALARIANLLKGCISNARDITKDRTGDYNPALLEWENSARPDTKDRIELLFPACDSIQSYAFKICVDTVFNGNYRQPGLTALEIERDIARCFIHSLYKLAGGSQAGYNQDMPAITGDAAAGE